MSQIVEECHGQFNTIVRSSASLLCPTRIHKFVWHLLQGGPNQAMRTTLLRARRFLATLSHPRNGSPKKEMARQEVLGLQPGEWVRVRSKDDIRAQLDSCERSGGLAWMMMMEGCCGKEYRVYKRVEKIVLESTGEIRRLKNTVLLENAICDGIYGCDRSCFFFWKEAWLERIDHRN